MDNKRGRELFRFDMSLMERLAKAGFPMSQINVQRRMRPQEASLLKGTLDVEEEDQAGQAAQMQQVRSEWPVSVVKSKSDLEANKLGHLVNLFGRPDPSAAAGDHAQSEDRGASKVRPNTPSRRSL